MVWFEDITTLLLVYFSGNIFTQLFDIIKGNWGTIEHEVASTNTVKFLLDF